MKKFLTLILINLLSFNAFANIDLAGRIENKITNTDPNVNIGIKITNLEKNKVIFEKNPDRYFIPGSALKFISLVALIEHFGLDYKFDTRIYNHNNDYYIDIHDPTFATADLSEVLKTISKHAEKVIKGNIYIVNSKFTVPPIMRTKTYSDTLYCNTGSITRAHINKNCSQLVAKSSDVGEKIKLKVPKYFPYIVENQAATVAKNVPDRLHINIDGDKYIINGTLSKSNDSLLIGGVADDNFVHIKQNIKQELMKYGIKFAGKILYGKPKSGAKDIASFSKKMRDISAIAMKQSDNFITDYLLAEYATQNKRHEWRMATKDLKRFIFNKFNVDLKKSSFGDASGVSRLNLFSVNQFDSFLKAVSKNSKFEEIKSLMASPGDGSTIGDRFKGMPKIYVKSGTLANVSTIVGYFYNKDNELHSFVIMINNFYGENSKYRALQESIIKLAAE